MLAASIVIRSEGGAPIIIFWSNYSLLPLYCGNDVWENIWNQTHLVVLNFCLERLHHITRSHKEARSNHWCQWPELFRTYRTVKFSNWDSGARNLSGSTSVQEFKFSHQMQIFYMISQLYQGWLMHIFIRQRQFLNSGPSDRQLEALIILTVLPFTV